MNGDSYGYKDKAQKTRKTDWERFIGSLRDASSWNNADELTGWMVETMWGKKDEEI